MTTLLYDPSTKIFSNCIFVLKRIYQWKINTVKSVAIEN